MPRFSPFFVVILMSAAACSGDKGDGPFVEICANGADDDGDGQTDCADSDCAAVCGELCDNGVDDDGDGQVDCDDFDCNGLCPEVCDDGRDNDGDRDVDCADADCSGECPEDCTDGVDNDGDGDLDCDDADCDSTCDADGDGAIAEGFGGDDCDDADAANYPGNVEVCDGGDNDCDDLIDDADPDVDADTTYWVDGDEDGWGDGLQTLVRCDQPPSTATQPGDCDDSDPDVSPDAVEVCNDIDDDCDGDIDADDYDVDLTTARTFYADDDNDTYGDASDSQVACSEPPGYVDNDLDCDDGDPTTTLAQPWLDDNDGDGFGAGTPSPDQCSPPANGWVPEANGIDCDDAAPLTYPGATEQCGDGIDQDCDGSDLACAADTASTWTVVGDATVDQIGNTWTGTETYEFSGTGSGTLVCAFTWDAFDWDNSPVAVGPDPIGVPCDDPDGNPCRFEFTVQKSGGVQTGGTDCSVYASIGLTQVNDGPYGYGWHDDYYVGGAPLGATLMYYYPPVMVWLGLEHASVTPFSSALDTATGDLDYLWVVTYDLPPP